ncbi:hypothetical protein KSS87_020212 [Heliosperma pusillum]|nr:hypothetical protein KSS87_020212 [Heliosperma pusillum]
MEPMDIVGKAKEDASLPKATMTKIIKEMLPAEVRVARDAQDLLIECCVEFINLVSSESNEVCNREDKRTIAPEHVLKALQKHRCTPSSTTNNYHFSTVNNHRYLHPPPHPTIYDNSLPPSSPLSHLHIFSFLRVPPSPLRPPPSSNLPPTSEKGLHRLQEGPWWWCWSDLGEVKASLCDGGTVLGFGDYTEEVYAAYEQHKLETMQDGVRSGKWSNSGAEMTEEEAAAEQQRMFAEARARMNGGVPLPKPDADPTPES